MAKFWYSWTWLLLILITATAGPGVFWSGTYAREAPAWAAQGIGQDYFNLFVFLPFLLVVWLLARRGSRFGALALGGGLLYSLYTYCLYAFFMRFGPLFLPYTAAFGLSAYLCFSLGKDILLPAGQPLSFDGQPLRAISFILYLTAGVFGLLWLGQIIPATLSGQVPREIVEAGLATNPVYVIDLGLLLPLMAYAAYRLGRRRPASLELALVLLSFSSLMSAAIGAMVISMSRLGGELAWPPIIFSSGIALAAAAAFVRATVIGIAKENASLS
jgi:hypothetical protein